MLACARGRMLLHGLGPDRAAADVEQLAAEHRDNEVILRHVGDLASGIPVYRRRPWYRDDFSCRETDLPEEWRRPAG